MLKLVDKLSDFMVELNSDYFWNEQSQAFFLAANYYLTALRDLVN